MKNLKVENNEFKEGTQLNKMYKIESQTNRNVTYMRSFETI